MTAPWSSGSVEDRVETSSVQLLQKLGIKDITAVLCSGRLRWYGHVPSPVSNLSQTFRSPAPEGKEGWGRHGLNVSRLISVIVAWLGLTHKTEILGEPVFGIAWCCQSHWMGHGQQPNLKMDMMIWWWLFIKSSRKIHRFFKNTQQWS